MNDGSQPERDAIEAIRREIDGLDDAMLSLVAERLKLADKLAQMKTAQSGLPIRSGREIILLRRLIAAAPAPLEREVVVELWRALIAAALWRQRVIDVVIGGGRNDPARLFDIARRHFGARARIKDLGEPQAALQRVAESPDTVVAVTTWPAAPGVGAWWPALSEQRFQKLHIIAGLPVMGVASDQPEAAVFAAADTEEAGGDVSILMAFDPHHRLQRALNDVGLAGKEFARAEPRVLVRIEGFVALNDPRAAAMTRSGLDSVRVLGSYARV
ncbi:MAG: chorismate mutase [Proteobacteria bacterium]|nr:chorismate mutase [Pseudomonadota bacterium]